MGLGFKHFHTEQELQRIRDVIYHTHSLSDTGHLYYKSFRLFLIELGLGTDLHRFPLSFLEILTINSLIKSIYTFLNEVFLTHGATFSEMARLNQSRLFLQAYYLSNLVTADGCILGMMSREWKRKSIYPLATLIPPPKGLGLMETFPFQVLHNQRLEITYGDYVLPLVLGCCLLIHPGTGFMMQLMNSYTCA